MPDASDGVDIFEGSRSYLPTEPWSEAIPGIPTTPPFHFTIRRFYPDVIAVEPEGEQTGNMPWSLVGGDEDDDSLNLYLIVGHPTERGLSARLVLSIPIIACDGRVTFGAPNVTEG